MTEVHGIVEPPVAEDLIAIVEAFLHQDVIPALADPKLRYRVRAAEHLLGLARRELERGTSLERDEDGYLVTRELIASFGSLERLNGRLTSGELDVVSPSLLSLLEDYVVEKLRIAAPELVK